MKFKIFGNESEFNFEIIDLQNPNIFLHKNLITNQKLEQFLLKNSSNKALSIMYHPIFLRKDSGETKYHLVAGHSVYYFYVSKGITSFPSIVITDEELLPEIFAIEQNKISLLDNVFNTSEINAEKIYASSATETRHRAKKSGQICPFCSGILRSSRMKEISEKGGFKISCENKSNKLINNGKGCDFEFFLTETEFLMFRKYEFPTSIWLKSIADKKCPKCKGEIYLRTLYKPNNENKVYEICAKRFSRKKECDYLKGLSK